MGDVAKEGRTVLLVSHNLASVSNLCRRACLIDNGQLVCDGETEDVIEIYMKSINQFDDTSTTTDNPLLNHKQREGSGQLLFSDMKIFDSKGNPMTLLKCGEDVTFELGYAGQENR